MNSIGNGIGSFISSAWNSLPKLFSSSQTASKSLSTLLESVDKDIGNIREAELDNDPDKVNDGKNNLKDKLTDDLFKHGIKVKTAT